MAKLRHYPSFAGTFVNRHPLPRYKMCDDLHIRQNAGVADPFFTGKNGNGSREADYGAGVWCGGQTRLPDNQGGQNGLTHAQKIAQTKIRTADTSNNAAPEKSALPISHYLATPQFSELIIHHQHPSNQASSKKLRSGHKRPRKRMNSQCFCRDSLGSWAVLGVFRQNRGDFPGRFSKPPVFTASNRCQHPCPSHRLGRPVPGTCHVACSDSRKTQPGAKPGGQGAKPQAGGPSRGARNHFRNRPEHGSTRTGPRPGHIHLISPSKPPQNRSASVQKEAKSTECGNETATKWQRSGNGNTLAIPQIRLRTSHRLIQLVSFLLTLTGRSSCATRHANMLRGQHFGPDAGHVVSSQSG